MGATTFIKSQISYNINEITGFELLLKRKKAIWFYTKSLFKFYSL